MYFGVNAWHAALDGDDTTVVQMFMDKHPTRFGLEYPLQENMGLTPLLQCMAGGNILMMDFLLERGANPNKKGVDGSTPLHYAMFYGLGGAAIVKRLIRGGADVSLINDCGFTALHSAVCRVEITRLRNTIHADHVDLSIKTHKDETERLLTWISASRHTKMRQKGCSRVRPLQWDTTRVSV
jgi:ankyrin repeat protein